MAKIYAPNKQYSGISAGVVFVQGVGECANPHLLDWFKSKGYKVTESSEKVTKEPEKVTENEEKEPVKKRNTRKKD